MDDVKVSIILSAYNEKEIWFRKAVESILNQSFSDFELILILDNPENKMLEKIISEYAAKDNRIIFVKNKNNLGLVKSLNKGLELARGKYIARMDADDISDESRIVKQYEFMESNPDIHLVGTSVDFIDEADNTIMHKTPIVKNSKSIKTYLKYTNVVVHPTFFFRRCILKSLEGYREITYAEDYDFMCRLVAMGYKATNLEEPLLKYRIRENSISRDKTLAQLYNAFYLKRLYKERLKSGKDSYNIKGLFTNGKISDKEIKAFERSEGLKEKANEKGKQGNKLEAKAMFLYSKLISKYARQNAKCTVIYKVLSKVLE